MMNRMAHPTPVRTYRKQTISAVAIETEFQILNTLLADKAAQLQLTEYRNFDHFCAWEAIDGLKTGFEVNYPTHFELRDKQVDLNFIKAAREAATLQIELNKQLARIVLPGDDLIEKIDKELNNGKVFGQNATLVAAK